MSGVACRQWEGGGEVNPEFEALPLDGGGLGGGEAANADAAIFR